MAKRARQQRRRDKPPPYLSGAGVRKVFAKWIAELAADTDRERASDKYRDWLSATAGVWHYSLHNQYLIASQRRGAEYLAGKAEWERRGGPLKPDAKPVWILAPAGVWRRRFVGVKIYDVRDTVGDVEVPRADFMLRGRAKRLGAVEQAASALGLTVRYVDGLRGLHGQCVGAEVSVVRSLPPRERMATLIHEYAHGILHSGLGQLVPHYAREAEAEGVAYVAMRALGERPKSATYLAFVGAEPKQLLASLKRISDGARRILEAINLASRTARRRRKRDAELVSGT